MQDIEIRTRTVAGHLDTYADGHGAITITVAAYADTPAGRLVVRLPVTQAMLDYMPAEYFDDHLREAMNKMIATSDELLRYRTSKLRERAARGWWELMACYVFRDDSKTVHIHGQHRTGFKTSLCGLDMSDSDQVTHWYAMPGKNRNLCLKCKRINRRRK